MFVWMSRRPGALPDERNTSIAESIPPDEFYRDDLAKISRAKLQRLIHQAHATLGNLARHLVVQFVENVLNRRHCLRGKDRTPRLARKQIENRREICCMSV